jgi:hypothetical protein
MPVKTCSWETFTAQGAAILDKLRDVIHEGNVRRVIVEHEGRTIAEFPLTAGVVGAVLAPVLAALGAIVAVLQNCTIHVERETEPAAATTAAAAAGPQENPPGAM